MQTGKPSARSTTARGQMNYSAPVTRAASCPLNRTGSRRPKRHKKFVACEDDKVLSFVSVDGDYLARLYVDPDYYGQGIGRELLRIGVREIGEGAWTIVLGGNKKAIALYESEGFRDISRFEGDNNGHPCTCLKLKRAA